VLRIQVAALPVALLAAALSVLGCTRPAGSAEASLVRGTVERYNTLLAQGYRSMDMGPIAEVATQVQAETEYIHMSSLAEGGVRLLPELRDLKFVEVSVEQTTALVTTLETWDYTHVDPASGAVIRSTTGLTYRLAWDLIKGTDGRWVVSDVRAIEASTTGPPGSDLPTAPLGK
jgi:hypothetical protein